MRELDALVVGGGISGLAIAHCLARTGLAVEVWEGAARAGGKIRTTQAGGFRLESAASMVVNLRSELDGFLRSTGLQASRRPRAPTAHRYVLHDDRLHEVPGRLGDLIRTPLLSTAGKLRLLAEPLVPRGAGRDESVAQFVTRRLGREPLDKFFEPYVAGPLAGDAGRAEAGATMPRLVALERRYGSLAIGALLARFGARGSGAARPQMFSFAGGMSTMVDTLARDGGFRVRTDRRVSEVWPVRGGWMARATTGGAVQEACAAQLVLSLPADAAAGLVRGLDAELSALLGAIEYAPIRVVHTGFDRGRIDHALQGSGFLVPRTSRFATNGCLWMSSLFPEHAPQGCALLSTYLGGARNPSAAQGGDERSLDAVLQMLRALLGVKVAPDLVRVESHARGLPLYHGAYSQRLQAIERRLALWPGLHLEANYKGGVGVRDRMLSAELAAGRILRQCMQPRPRRTGAVRPVIGARQLAALGTPAR